MPELSNADSSGVELPTSSGVGINSPGLSKGLKARRRSITSVDQLNLIAGSLEESSKERKAKNAKIAAKYNAERPYDPADLKAEGLGWKSNFSFKPFATTIDKIAPRLTRAVNEARYLTSAELPPNVEGGKVKTEKFRAGITKLIRAWPGWVPFLNEVAAEDATYGFTSAVWLDKYSWKPVHFRQDRFDVPDQTKQSAAFCQIWKGRQDVQIHELVNLIDSPEAAEAAGWDLEAAVEAINEARPKDSNESTAEDRRTYEDAIRESSVSMSLQNGAKMVELNHFFVTEANGKVSYYLTNARGTKKLLRQQLDLYDSMAEALVFFSYQQANGLLMGSKGVGRELYEIAGARDRALNELVDRLQLSGKVWLTGTGKDLERFRLSVVGNVVLLPENIKPVDQVKVDTGAQEFAVLDAQLAQCMDTIAGAVTPRQLPGDRVTATQVNLYASREEESRDTITERFLMQVAEVVTVCQRRIVDPEIMDPDALALREDLLGYMSEEELQQLASEPALRTVEDWTTNEAESIVLFAQEKRNDPLFDQVALARMACSARISPEFAEAVLLPVNDSTQEAEQARTQTLELIALSLGKAIPVSSRDNHRIHADIIKEDFAEVFPRFGVDPEGTLPEIQAKLQHWQEHYELALQGGALADDWVEDQRMLEAIAEQLAEFAPVVPEEGEVEL